MNARSSSCKAFAKCRRADIPIPAATPRGILRHSERSLRSEESLFDFNRLRRGSSTCKPFAKCRRADIFHIWKSQSGVAA